MITFMLIIIIIEKAFKKSHTGCFTPKYIIPRAVFSYYTLSYAYVEIYFHLSEEIKKKEFFILLFFKWLRVIMQT